MSYTPLIYAAGNQYTLTNTR